MSEQWKPSSASVRWTVMTDQRWADWLDGEEWPEEVVVEAWERNDRAERRIKAERIYVPKDAA